MAVVKVFGSIDGKEIIFEYEGGDRWIVPVPPDNNGKYVIELFAEDDAGNIAYVAKYLYVFDSQNFTVSVTPMLYQSDLVKCDCDSDIRISDYISVLQDYYNVNVGLSDFVVNVRSVDNDKGNSI